jgi:hypothetical protein
MKVVLIQDNQSRITRYGMKCFNIIDGVKCQAFAHAKKKGNKILISDSYSDCIDENGNTVSGVYKIINIGEGRIAEIICEKIS